MPELPEVETVVRGLRSKITNKAITDVTVFRSTPVQSLPDDQFCRLLTGRIIRKVTRRAKYLIFHLEPELYLIGHLRMTGKFIVSPILPKPGKYQRVWFHLDDLLMIYEDVRCLGTLEICENLEKHPKIQKLGVEPLSQDFNATYLQQCFHKAHREIKSVLLDQSKIAGIGNIYASEILFDIGIHPQKQAGLLTFGELKNLVLSTQKILRKAIRENGTSISDFRRVDDKTGAFQNFLQVYARDGQSCRKCNTVIKRIVQQQRSSFYCPQCQQ